MKHQARHFLQTFLPDDLRWGRGRRLHETGHPEAEASKLIRYHISTAGVFMLRTLFAVTSLIISAEIISAPAGLAGPPYSNCSEARADGRSSIPSTDPAYRPDLDADGDGLACEPPKGRRSTR